MRSYVVPIDFTKSSDLALDYAIARARRRKAELILVHVLAETSLAAVTSEDSGSAELVIKAQQVARDNARNAMAKLVEGKKLRAKEHRVVLIERMDAAAAIVAQARKSRARMIIMGSEGRTGIKRLFSGSVAEATLRLARRPVLIVKRSRFTKAPAKLILVPIDFSKVSERALKNAGEIAKAERESLLLVNVVTDSADKVPFYLREEYYRSLVKAELGRIQQLARRVGITPRRYRALVLRARDAASAIANEAKKSRVSMIVMGSQGRSGLKQLVLGSVAEKTLRYAACPVLVFKK